MSTEYQALTGEYHLTLKIKGPTSAISLFHRLMRRCDNDWPWKDSSSGGRICEACYGVLYKGPRINPEDIKIAAKQVGDIHIKIRSYTPESKCHVPPKNFVPTRWIQKDLMDTLCLPGGPAAVKRIFEEEARKRAALYAPYTPPTPVVVPAGAPLVVLATSETKDFIPDPPRISREGMLLPAGDGSLIQFPEGDWDGVIQ